MIETIWKFGDERLSVEKYKLLLAGVASIMRWIIFKNMKIIAQNGDYHTQEKVAWVLGPSEKLSVIPK